MLKKLSTITDKIKQDKPRNLKKPCIYTIYYAYERSVPQEDSSYAVLQTYGDEHTPVKRRYETDQYEDELTREKERLDNKRIIYSIDFRMIDWLPYRDGMCHFLTHESAKSYIENELKHKPQTFNIVEGSLVNDPLAVALFTELGLI